MITIKRNDIAAGNLLGDNHLMKKHASPDEKREAELILKNISERIFTNTDADSIDAKIIFRFGEVMLRITYPGPQYNPIQDNDNWEDFEEGRDYQPEDIDPYRNRLSWKYSSNKNTVTFLVHSPAAITARRTLIALVFGLVFGIIIRTCLPKTIGSFIDTNLFMVIRTLFLNVLKMLIAPVIFFSISSSICNVSKTVGLKKLSEIVILYISTTVLAIFVGFFSAFVSTIGLGDKTLLLQDSGKAVQQTIDLSFSSFVTGLIPSDLISPILSSNMLQIMFVAVIFGVTAGAMGEKTERINMFTETCNQFFLKMITLIMSTLPIVSFCSMADIVLNLGIDSLYVILRISFGFIFGLFLMETIYCLYIKFRGNLSIFPYIKKGSKYFLTPFALSSSSAAIPSTIEFLDKKMGVNRKLSSITIPLGSVMNMDGTCIYLLVCVLMFMRLSGTALTPSSVVSLSILAFILSIGAPGVPGAGFLCLATLLASQNITIEYLSLVIGMDSLYSMFRAASNTMGDVAMTTVVASRLKMLDMDIYNS